MNGYRSEGGTCLRLRFDETSEIYLHDFTTQISHILANYHVSVNVPKHVVLWPSVEATGLSIDRMYEILRQAACEFGPFQGRLLTECQIHPEGPGSHQNVIFIQAYIKNISQLNVFLTESFGLRVHDAALLDLVFIPIAACFPGYEYELNALKTVVDDFVKYSSSFINLCGESLELVERFGALSPVQSNADRTVFKFEGGKAKARKSFVRLEGEVDVDGSLTDDGSPTRSTAHSIDASFDPLGSNISMNSSSARPKSMFTFPLGETELSSYPPAVVGESPSQNSIFAFVSPSNMTSLTGDGGGGVASFQNTPRIPTSTSFNQLAPGPPPLSTLSSSSPYGQPSPGKGAFGQLSTTFDGHSPIGGYASHSPSTASFLHSSQSPHPADVAAFAMPARTPSLKQSDLLSADRDFLRQGLSGGSQQLSWLDNGSDILADTQSSVGSDYINTRQRQFSDPVIPDSRQRQYSDPVVPNQYRSFQSANFFRRPTQSPTVMSPDRSHVGGPEGSRPPIGSTYFGGNGSGGQGAGVVSGGISSANDPASSIHATGPYRFNDLNEILNRGRSISESGTAEGGPPQFVASTPSGMRSSLTCPHCHVGVKRTQTVCFRCRNPLPLSATGPGRNLYGHPSDASFGSDLSHSTGLSVEGLAASSPSASIISSTATSGKGEPTVREGDWICVYCHGHNFATKIACFTCHAARPGFERGIPVGQMEALGIGRLGGSSAEAKPGDWTCPKCHENVFAKRNRCYRCTTSRPRKLSH